MAHFVSEGSRGHAAILLALAFLVSLPWSGPLSAKESPSPALQKKQSSKDSSLPVWLLRSKWDTHDGQLPPDFRTMQYPLKGTGNGKPLPSSLGLADLHSSGSSEFSADGFEMIRQKTSGYKLMVIDLRQEPHGLINGGSISWFAPKNQVNWGKTLSEIEKDEKARLEEIRKNGKATTFKLGKTGGKGDDPRAGIEPVVTRTDNVMSEQQLCEANGVGYVRLPVPDDQSPGDKEVDQFVSLAKGTSDNTWLHMHCAAGHGRTTTFLTMYDMMHNAPSVSCDDIVARQHLIGGINLFKKEPAEDWKAPYAEKRAQFIRDFYRYCQSESPNGFKRSWSEWKTKAD